MLTGPELSPEGKAERLVILIHGLGADGNDLIQLAPALAEAVPNTHWASPDAPFECDMGPGLQWFSLKDPSPQSVIEGVKNVAPHLNEYIDSKLQELGLDESKLVVIGFSQGTMTGLFVSISREKKIAGVLGYSGALIGDTDDIKSKPPVCLVHGQLDNVVPHDMMKISENDLTNNGFVVETHSIPNIGHGIDDEGVRIGQEFLKKCFNL